MKRVPSYQLYAAITILCWSVAFPATTIAMTAFSSVVLAFLRYFTAGVLLLVVVLVKRIAPPALRDWGWFLACGLIGFVLYPVLFNYGCAATPSSLSSTIIAVTPLLTAAFARVWLRERLSRGQWGSIFLAFIGVLVLLLEPEAGGLSPTALWLLGAAVCLAAYNLLQRKLTGRYTSLQVSAYSILAGALVLLPLGPRAAAQLSAASVDGVVCAVLLGIFSSAIAYVSWAKAFSLAPSASSVSNYMFLTPFLATLLGFCIAGEVPTLRTLMGGGVILLGMFLFQRARKPA